MRQSLSSNAGGVASSGKNDIFARVFAIKIAASVLDAMIETGLSTLLGTLALANGMAAPEDIDAARFDVSRGAARRDVVTGQGMIVPMGRIETFLQPDGALLLALKDTDGPPSGDDV